MDDLSNLWALRNSLESRITSSLGIAERLAINTDEAFSYYSESAYLEASALNQVHDYTRQIEALDRVVNEFNEQKFRLEGLEK